MLGFLLFAGALHVNLDDLKADKWPIAVLATVGVVVSTAIVGALTWGLMPILGLHPSFIGCLLFGAADAMRLALPSLGLELNPQLLVAAPYLLALTVMVVVAQSQREPRALGKPFERGLV